MKNNKQSNIMMKQNIKQNWRIYKKNKSIVNSASLAIIFAVMAVASGASAQVAPTTLPTGGNVVAGQATIGTAGNTMNINQSSNTAIINWDNFSIGADGVVNILNGTGATLNKVVGQSVTTILGQLNATGSAYVMNENGIVVGSSGQLTSATGSIGLTTGKVDEAAFKEDGAFKVDLSKATNTITNAGTINGGQNVYVAGAQVNNTGFIGGSNVELTAEAANPLAAAINNTGTIYATKLNSVDGGRIVLSSTGNVNNSGTIDASGTRAIVIDDGGWFCNRGNSCTTNTKPLQVANNAPIFLGKPGSVTIKATNVHLASTSKISGGNVRISAAQGDWRNGEGTLKMAAGSSITAKAIMLESGIDKSGSSATRTDLTKDVEIKTIDGKFAQFFVNGFDDVEFNVDNNSKITTDGSMVVNARNIKFDEDIKVKGDFIVNAAAYDDTTQSFVSDVRDDTSGTEQYYSHGWANGYLENNLAATSGIGKRGTGQITFAGDKPLNFDLCCAVSITSGVDANGDRANLTSADVNFSYNKEVGEANEYNFFEAKGFDTFDTTFEGGSLNVNVTDAQEQNSKVPRGFVTLINGTNNIDHGIKAKNNVNLIAFQDVNLGANAKIEAGKNVLVVVDEETPLQVGDGKLVMDSAATIDGKNVQIYTARQDLNKIDGKINGANFVPGAQFTNTNQEQWTTFFQTDNDADTANPEVHYKNSRTVVSRPDCETNPDAAGCESQVVDLDQGKEFRVNLAQDSTEPEEGALAWGNSSQIRNNEYYTVSGTKDYVDTKLNTFEKLETFWYAIPLELVNIPLSGLSTVPGIQGIVSAVNPVNIINNVAGTNIGENI